MAMARESPSTNERTSAATTRTSVTSTKSRRKAIRLLKIRSQPGITKGGTTKERSSQSTASSASAITISRGKRNGALASRASTDSLTMASRSFTLPSPSGRSSRGSRLVDDALVGKLGDVPGVHGHLEHVPDGRALAFPGRQHLVDQSSRAHRFLEDTGRELGRADHDAVGVVEVRL